MGYIGLLTYTLIVFLFFYSVEKEKYRIAFWVCILLALYLRIWISSDPFLHVFDERYHALVAKHLLYYGEPLLYANPILEHNSADWTQCEVWLHKPPLPLLFIAASLKLFGLSVYAVRMPSIIFSMLTCVLTYRICLHLFHRRIALIAFFLHAIHGLSIELVGGRVSSDHTDVFYLFFVELALYLVIVKKKNPLIILVTSFILLFAFLSKWIAVFIPVLIISIYFIIYRVDRMKHILFYFLSTLFIGISYLAFVSVYPDEVNQVFSGIMELVTDEKSPHQGGAFYYINRIRIIYGELIYIPLLMATYSVMKYRCRLKDQAFILLWIMAPLILMSFLDAKRATYSLVFAPAVFILSSYYYYVFRHLCFRNKRVKRIICFLIMVLIIALPIRYNIERMKFFSEYSENRVKSKSIELITNIDSFDHKNTIVIDEEFAIEFMFYHNLPAYHNRLTLTEISKLNAEGKVLVKRYENRLMNVE